ncbi:2-amino-4-hydroxy-6-hydroxymethyldihydropteridine diphosphokinase, partial [Streptococcus suis]|uniref:2-amino-4-hydroxy-6- hydroxymethyldihydropteridine diphosphokinase n=1 Tax=Streptococcus suis TaxID=1307 RepID=UPI0029C42F3A
LDLDLLSYGCLVLVDPVLTLPHPRMMARAFVLTPLAELMATLGDLGDDERQSGLRLPDLAIQNALAKSQGIERLGPAPDWRTG